MPSDSNMDPQFLGQAIEAAGIEAFQSMCGLIGKPLKGSHEMNFVTAAAVEFRGPQNGHFIIRTSEALPQKMASGMLGEDVPPVDQGLESLKEMSNIICGQILKHVDPNDPFKILSPFIMTSDMDLPQKTITAQAVLSFKEGTAEIILIV